MIYLYSGNQTLRVDTDAISRIRVLGDEDVRAAKLDRVEALSAAHRLISSLADQTNSRSEIEECRDVMAKLERMVEDNG